MLRKFLSCDLCGDKWDITDTDYYKMINPGLYYTNNKVIEGSRQFVILRATALSEDRVSKTDLDICDKCYNKLERFMFDLKEGGADANL